MTASNHLFSALDNLCQSREQAFLDVVSKTFKPMVAVENDYPGRIAVLMEKSLIALLGYYHNDGRLITLRSPLPRSGLKDALGGYFTKPDLKHKVGYSDDLCLGKPLSLWIPPDDCLSYEPVIHLFVEPLANCNHEQSVHEKIIDQILMQTNYFFLQNSPKETLWRER